MLKLEGAPPPATTKQFCQISFASFENSRTYPTLELKIAEIPSSEPMRIGPGGSRAHPGVYYKLKSGFIMMYLIIREFFWRK